MDIDMLTITKDERYFIKTMNRNKLKLARASNSIIHFAGEVLFIAGTAQERERGREYLSFVMVMSAATGAPTWNNFTIYDAKKKFLKKKVVMVDFVDKRDGKVTTKPTERLVEDFQQSPWVGKCPDLEKTDEGRGDLSVFKLDEK